MTGGVLHGLKVGTPYAANEAGVASGDRFDLASLGNASGWDDGQLQSASVAAGITQFRRPEDGAGDPNHPNVYYFAMTDQIGTTPANPGATPPNAGGGDTRLWKLTFDDIAHPELGGKIEVVQGSPAALPGEMFDNVTVNSNSDVLLQEDPGNQAYVAKVWQQDASTGDLVQIAAHTRSLFDPAYGGADKNFLTQDEESSGIIDLSGILGPRLLPGGCPGPLCDQRRHPARVRQPRRANGRGPTPADRSPSSAGTRWR